MARIKFSALVTSIRGSIGGTTFQRNAYGFTVKNKPNIVNPKRQDQRIRQSLFSLQMQKWGTLTNAQRDLWTNYALAFPIASRLNPDSNLNGFNYFCKYHLQRSLNDKNFILSDPNGTRGNLTALDITLVQVGGNLNFEAADIIDNTNFFVQILLTRIVPASQTYIQATPFYISFLDRSVETDKFIQIPYVEKFGIAPGPGEKVGARVVYVNKSAGQLIEFPLQPVIVL